MRLPPELSPLLVESSVRMALEEDLGRAGDITSQATIRPDARAQASLVSRRDGVVAGMSLVRAAFTALDGGIEFEAQVINSDRVVAGQMLAQVEGNARAVLSAERVALNFLMHLSGVATETATYVECIAGTGARICCTRKTLPGLRALEKYAVRCGGGSNHRFGLDDAILIKDNHIAIAGGVAAAVDAARAFAGHLVRVEVEVDTLVQFEEAISAEPDAVLLDNMSPDMLRAAVRMNAGRVVLEASGNVDLSSVRAIAETGVDFISTSKITMAAPPLDVGLDISID